VIDNKVVIAGMGMVSPIGNTLERVLGHMLLGRSGVTAAPEAFRSFGITCGAYGAVGQSYEQKLNSPIPKGLSEQGRLAYYATIKALSDAEIVDEKDRIKDSFQKYNIGVYIGTGGSPITTIVQHAQQAGLRDLPPKEQKRVAVGLKRAVQQVMSSAVSAGIGVALGVRGETISVASACATGHHNVIAAARALLLGETDIALAGGVEDVCLYTDFFFDTIPALSTRWNETPQRASRPFDTDRDGFVPSSGAGVVVLTTEAFARRHALPIQAYLVGWGSNANGASMVKPETEGEVEVMRIAIERSHLEPSDIDLVSAHGTSTPDGDAVEAEAIKRVFGVGQNGPLINSGKSLTGHGLGAAGAWSLIMTVLEMQHNFVHQSINIKRLDPVCEGLNIVEERVSTKLLFALVNAFGFGGANASLVVQNAKALR
jgi:3-oxoacyl-[acyl-carrier-protein] synthase I